MDSPSAEEESWMPYDNQEYFTVQRGGMQGRTSTCLNDDNYDYAIELKLDDEYRQAADALPSIAELEDLEDDDLLIILDEKRQSCDVGLSRGGSMSMSQSPQLKGIVKYLRDSLSISPSFSSRRQTVEKRQIERDEDNMCIIDVVPSPLRDVPESATESNRGSNTKDITSQNTDITHSPAPNSESKLRALSPKRMTPLRSVALNGTDQMNKSLIDHSYNPTINRDDQIQNLTHDPDEEIVPHQNVELNADIDQRWSLSAMWKATKESARPLSLRLAAASARLLRPKEPLNPVTSLFEPATVISNKSLLVISGKGKMDIKEVKRVHSNWDDGRGGNPLPPGQFLGWRSPGTQIWARLKMAGLEVKCVFSWDLRRIILKIRCPQRRLEDVAERMHLKLKNREGAIRRFKVSRRETFRPDGYSGTIFRSTERQQIIDFIIRCRIKDGGAELDENTELGNHIVQRFPLHMYARLIDIRHSWVTFWKREKAGQIPRQWSPFSIPLAESFSRIGASIGYVLNNLLTQPLDSIAEYFGEAIAFYFAYTAFYTKCLVWPALLGVVVFCFQINAGTLDHWTCLPYSVFVMIWACLTLALWGQKASTLAYRWGMLDFEANEMERPQFHGTHFEDLEGAISKKHTSALGHSRDSKLHSMSGSRSGLGSIGSKRKEEENEYRKAYPAWRRLIRYCFSIPPVVAALAVILIVMSTVFTTQDKLFYEYEHHQKLNFRPEVTLFSISFRAWLDGSASSANSTSSQTSNSTITSTSSTSSTVPVGRGSSNTWGSKIAPENLRDFNFWTVTFLYPCIYGILVDVAVKLFAFLALRLTNFENHRTQTTFMNRLILKVFSFRFITIFTSLYYYAFFTSDHEGAYVRISVTVFSLITVGQWWGALIDICVPSIVYRAMMYRMKVNVLAVNRNIYRAREYVDACEEARGRDKALKIAVDKRAAYLDQARATCWAEAMQFQYNNFHDYSSIIVQFCFVLFFASVFPLLPLIALLNNVVLLRVSAYKVCFTRQRPIALKSAGLGVWEDVLQIMSVVGILTNCGIMGYTSTVLQTHLIPIIGVAGMVISLFALEHFILFLKYWLSAAIPRVPVTVQRSQARDRRSLGRKKQVRQAEKKKRRNQFSDHFFPTYMDDEDDDTNLGDISLNRSEGYERETYGDTEKDDHINDDDDVITALISQEILEKYYQNENDSDRSDGKNNNDYYNGENSNNFIHRNGGRDKMKFNQSYDCEDEEVNVAGAAQEEEEEKEEEEYCDDEVEEEEGGKEKAIEEEKYQDSSPSPRSLRTPQYLRNDVCIKNQLLDESNKYDEWEGKEGNVTLESKTFSALCSIYSGAKEGTKEGGREREGRKERGSGKKGGGEEGLKEGENNKGKRREEVNEVTLKRNEEEFRKTKNQVEGDQRNGRGDFIITASKEREKDMMEEEGILSKTRVNHPSNSNFLPRPIDPYRPSGESVRGRTTDIHLTRPSDGGSIKSWTTDIHHIRPSDGGSIKSRTTDIHHTRSSLYSNRQRVESHNDSNSDDSSTDEDFDFDLPPSVSFVGKEKSLQRKLSKVQSNCSRCNQDSSNHNHDHNCNCYHNHNHNCNHSEKSINVGSSSSMSASMRMSHSQKEKEKEKDKGRCQHPDKNELTQDLNYLLTQRSLSENPPSSSSSSSPSSLTTLTKQKIKEGNPNKMQNFIENKSRTENEDQSKSDSGDEDKDINQKMNMNVDMDRNENENENKNVVERSLNNFLNPFGDSPVRSLNPFGCSPPLDISPSTSRGNHQNNYIHSEKNYEKEKVKDEDNERNKNHEKSTDSKQLDPDSVTLAKRSVNMNMINKNISLINKNMSTINKKMNIDVNMKKNVNKNVNVNIKKKDSRRLSNDNIKYNNSNNNYNNFSTQNNILIPQKASSPDAWQKQFAERMKKIEARKKVYSVVLRSPVPLPVPIQSSIAVKPIAFTPPLSPPLIRSLIHTAPPLPFPSSSSPMTTCKPPLSLPVPVPSSFLLPYPTAVNQTDKIKYSNNDSNVINRKKMIEEKNEIIKSSQIDVREENESNKKLITTSRNEDRKIMTAKKEVEIGIEKKELKNMKVADLSEVSDPTIKIRSNQGKEKEGEDEFSRRDFGGHRNEAGDGDGRYHERGGSEISLITVSDAERPHVRPSVRAPDTACASVGVIVPVSLHSRPITAISLPQRSSPIPIIIPTPLTATILNSDLTGAVSGYSSPKRIETTFTAPKHFLLPPSTNPFDPPVAQESLQPAPKEVLTPKKSPVRAPLYTPQQKMRVQVPHIALNPFEDMLTSLSLTGEVTVSSEPIVRSASPVWNVASTVLTGSTKKSEIGRQDTLDPTNTSISLLAFEEKLTQLENQSTALRLIQREDHPLAAALVAGTKTEKGGKIVRAFSPVRTGPPGDVGISLPKTMKPIVVENIQPINKGKFSALNFNLKEKEKERDVNVQQMINVDENKEKIIKKVRIDQKSHERENIAKLANLQQPHYQQPLMRSALAGSREKTKLLSTTLSADTPGLGPLVLSPTSAQRTTLPSSLSRMQTDLSPFATIVSMTATQSQKQP